MRIIRKQRVQGIYTWPPEQRRDLDKMLAQNLTYKEIIAALAEMGVKTSSGSLSEYFGRGLKHRRADAVFANGTRSLVSSGSLAISITAPDGFIIEASVTDGRAIHLTVIERPLAKVE
jgi:hypothetical protein